MTSLSAAGDAPVECSRSIRGLKDSAAGHPLTTHSRNMLRTTITQTTRTAVRATTTASSASAPRTFVTTAVAQKTVTETVKETADKVRCSA